ncbi:MAG: 9-O-acetylesterase [Phycisphaerae bacterium]|nr:9-O-acetylesterase [Phycisphaerae bacterium]
MKRHSTATVLLLLLHATAVFGEVTVPSIISDNMVLQRGMAAPIWGRAIPGDTVKVTFAGQEHEVVAADDGTWMIRLEPMPTSNTPRSLVIEAGNRIQIDDVLVGDVWVCSGQSNMEWPVSASADAAAEIKAGDHPDIRMFMVARNPRSTAQYSVQGRWDVCSPSTVGAFSAVGYYMARTLQQELGVPLGILNTTWGGTRIEPWIRLDDLVEHPAFTERASALAEQVAAHENRDELERMRQRRKQMEAYSRTANAYWADVLKDDPGMSGGWIEQGFDDSGWPTMDVPTLWKDVAGSDLASFDGVLWMRRAIGIPVMWNGRDLQLDLGRIDDSDMVFFNGTRIGMTTEQHQRSRQYRVPGTLVETGMSVLAVAVIDAGGVGGMTGPASAMTVVPINLPAGAKPPFASLAGPWKYMKGSSGVRRGPVVPGLEASPGSSHSSYAALYNGMVSPLVPYGIRGFTWYQGESNSREPEPYRELLPLLIDSWRSQWGQGDLPFGIVQLASFRAPNPHNPNEGGWALLRDAQLHARRTVENTGLVVTIDIGDADDIHPRNKQDVGKRLAMWALATSHGRTNSSSGPIASARVRTNHKGHEAFAITFEHATEEIDGGLVTSDGRSPRGLGICGPDGIYHWASAEIQDNTLIVWSDVVKDPVSVVYAWSNNPDRVNLTNGSGLPATPFRFD